MKILRSFARFVLHGFVLTLPTISLTAQPNGTVKWHIPLGSVLSAGPAVGSNGLVYGVARAEVSSLYAWDAGTGELRWQTNLSGLAFDGGPLVNGRRGHIYACTTTGTYAIHSETGAHLWRSPVYGAMAVGGDGTLFVVSEGGELHALEPSTGVTRWQTQGAQASGTPIVGGNGVVFCITKTKQGFPGGITAWGSRDDTVMWSFEQGTAAFSLLVLTADGTVVAGGDDGEVFALDASAGRLLWNFQGPGPVSDIVIAADGALCVAHDEMVHVRDGRSGELRRRLPLTSARRPKLALAADGTLYVAPLEIISDTAQFWALNFETGRTNWVFALAGFQIPKFNLGPDGTTYFEADGLYALHGDSPLADSPWPKAWQNPQNTGHWETFGAPRITQQPPSHWAAVNKSTAFHFFSPTARPWHVQWHFNGQPISGATNESLFIEPVQFSDAGRYSVSLSNPIGVALSDEATLSVGYGLDVTVTGPGLVHRAPALAVYPTNSVVELRAETVRSNHHFQEWSGDITGTSKTMTLTLEHNYSVDAKFEYLRPDVKWAAPFGDVPALGTNGILYAFHGDMVTAVDAATGTNVWEAGYLDGWWAPPAIGPDNTIYVGNYGGSSIWAYHPDTGAELWAFNVGICVHSCPTIGVDGTLFLAGVKVYAVDPVTHTEKWSFAGGDIFESSPALGSDAVLYAGSYDGKMYALDARTGAKLWEFATGGLLHSSPALGADGTVYFGSGDGKVYALRAADGSKRWEFATADSVLASPVVGPDGVVYIGSTDNSIYALDGQSGQMKWRFGTGRRVLSTGALAADGTLYLGGHGGALLALESRTGRKLWSFGYSAGTPTIGPDGTIYCAGAAYYGTSPLAISPWPKFHRDLESRGRAHARPLLAPANSPHTSEGFKVHVYAEVGEVLNVESTTDLQVWTSLHTLTNTTGNLEFFDPSGLAPRRFYRVSLER